MTGRKEVKGGKVLWSGRPRRWGVETPSGPTAPRASLGQRAGAAALRGRPWRTHSGGRVSLHICPVSRSCGCVSGSLPSNLPRSCVWRTPPRGQGLSDDRPPAPRLAQQRTLASSQGSFRPGATSKFPSCSESLGCTSPASLTASGFSAAWLLPSLPASAPPYVSAVRPGARPARARGPVPFWGKHLRSYSAAQPHFSRICHPLAGRELGAASFCRQPGAACQTALRCSWC